MYKQVTHTRAALMGLLFAMVGFSFAVATTDGRGLSSGDDAGSRVVGSATLRFTNPKIGSDRDLGDVVQGSFLVRYARATGGVRPYKFTSTRTPTLKEALAGGTSTLDLLLSGALTGAGTNAGGTIAGLAASKFPLRFNIDVSDSKGSNAATAFDTFRFSLESTTTFKFAKDALCEGVQFQPYLDNIPTLNGNGAITYSVSNVRLNGTVLPGGLEAVGLSLAATDGTVFGKPYQAGTVTFDATAKDAKGASALNRAKTAVNQSVTLTITGSILITSDFVTTGVQIKVDTAKPGKDSIRYSGIVNLVGQKISDFNKDAFILRIGKYTSPSTTDTPNTFDDRGKIVKGPKSKTAVTLKGSINSKGQLKAQISKETLSSLFGTLTGSKTVLAVSLQIGDLIASSEMLEFELKQSKSKFTLTNKFGTATPSGNFLITGVKGKDDSKSAAEDTAYKVSFIGQSAGKITASTVNTFTQAGFGSPDKAVVSIGSNFIDTIGVTESKNKLKSTEKRDAKSAKVTKLSMDAAKGKGSLTTGFLPKTSTGISEGAKAKTSDNPTFPLSILLTKSNAPTYQGEAALAIFPAKKGYTEKNPSK